MKLCLQANTCRGEALRVPLSAEFGIDGGQIGRATDNAWTLPDKQHFISAHHASISFEAGRFVITDTSTNGLYLNDSAEPLGRSNSATLADGDRLTIGDYEIGITITDADQMIGEAPPVQSGNGLATPAEALELPAYGQPGAPVPADALFAPVPPPPVASPLQPGGSAPNHVADLDTAFTPSQLIPDDWDLDEKPSHDSPPTGPVIRDGAPGAPTATQPAPDAPAPHLTRATTEDAETLQAFLRGAGLAGSDLATAQDARVLETAGRMLRAMTEGLMQVLRARSQIKNEFRMQMTTIRPVENNPLKFSVGVDEALLRLLSSDREQGFLNAETAVREAVGNIEAHQVATLAGLEEAIKDLFTRFDPERLEQEFTKNSLLDRLLPDHREARYWALFKESFQELAEDAEEDFDRLFSRAFARAYEAQVRRLESEVVLPDTEPVV